MEESVTFFKSNTTMPKNDLFPKVSKFFQKVDNFLNILKSQNIWRLKHRYTVCVILTSFKVMGDLAANPAGSLQFKR